MIAVNSEMSSSTLMLVQPLLYQIKTGLKYGIHKCGCLFFVVWLLTNGKNHLNQVHPSNLSGSKSPIPDIMRDA